MKRKALISLSLALSTAFLPALPTSATTEVMTTDSQGNRVETHTLPKAETNNDEPIAQPARVETSTTPAILDEDGEKIDETYMKETDDDDDNDEDEDENEEEQSTSDNSEELFGLFDWGNDSGSDSGSDSTDPSGNTETTKTATILVAVDEEYRSAYSDWQTMTHEIVEKADDAFTRDHNIDFEVKAIAKWSSEGNNASEILSDLDRDFNGNGYDFVVGFTRDANFNSGGIAYVYPYDPNGSAISVNLDQGPTNTWHAAQHEFSHNYGLGHDAQGSGIKCIMNYDYSYVIDYWGQEHNQMIQDHRDWYGQ
ncbi:peptidase M84 [Pontibacillus halophilus JSM 076056 = DSM 19796]|uniref:Peptidase M84 n=1 Tax=Pontibacillus halophilus JSM 076056 = DSM 19796 TaxID=1385510 RepID=A0A0A5GF19_9BACI|nr:zinc-dependent metalloprotease [Pontibacillus halophilus]KGX89715.1 peptidase M84 [Pontibacillus halophilus JSM 076056 = DSM 19796]